ncbi:MAG: ROK family protein [Nocardioides sp.]
MRTRRSDLDVRRSRKAARSVNAVLAAVLDRGPVARSNVARLTGLSPASVSMAGAQLIGAGLLREAPEAADPPGIGRPHVPLEIDTERIAVVGAHIAVGSIRVGLLDLRGRVIAQRRLRHRDGSPQAILGDIAALTRELVAGHGDRRVLGLGVATGGWVDPGAGVVVEHARLGWRDVPVASRLATSTGMAVGVDSHARALLCAERWLGSHPERVRASVVHLFVGGVVDVAFGVRGRVQQGPRSAAGTVSHLPVEGSTATCPCGRVGCLEATVSSGAVAEEAHRRGLIASPAYDDLMAAADRGDPEIAAMLRARARQVGRASAVLLDLFDPDILMVTARGLAERHDCMDQLRAEVARRSLTRADPGVSVAGSSFPRSYLLVAGGAVVLERVLAAPLRVSAAVPRAS